MAKKKHTKGMAFGGSVGGKPGESAMARAEASRSVSGASSSPRDGGFAGAGRSAGGGGSGGGAMRNKMPGEGGVAGDAGRLRSPNFPRSGLIPMPMGKRKSSGQYPTVNRAAKGSLEGSMTGKDPARLKSGGVVDGSAVRGKTRGKIC